MSRGFDDDNGCFIILVVYAVIGVAAYGGSSILAGEKQLFIITVVTVAITVICSSRSLKSKNKVIEEKEKAIRKLEGVIYGNEREKISLKEKINELTVWINKKDALFQSFNTRDTPSIQGITELYSDFITIQDSITAEALQTKKRPAFHEAYRIKECKAEKRKYIEQYKLMLYKYEALLHIFPELVNYVDDFETIKQLSSFEDIENFKEEYDKVRDWLSKEEYQKLSIDERNQLALDRYFQSSKKSLWQIGRDYEMYCGYRMREKGFHVTQFGIEKRLEDLGRDIIAQRGNEVYIIHVNCGVKRKLFTKSILPNYTALQ